MDEYAQIYWLDERNAGRDHRTQSGGLPASWRPGIAPVVRAPASPMPAVRYPAQTVVAQPIAAQSIAAQPVAMMQAHPATYFGGLGLGQIIDMAAQALAAFQPLPAAPIATAEVVKDVGNLVLYQAAIAQHAKRDEQLRTLGSLISKLVK